MNLDKRLQFSFPEGGYTATSSDAMLYALSAERNVAVLSNGRAFVGAT